MNRAVNSRQRNHARAALLQLLQSGSLQDQLSNRDFVNLHQAYRAGRQYMTASMGERKKKAALFAAIFKDDIEKVADLLESDPELVNARDADGETPIMLASSGNMIELVMAFEPDMTALDVAGRTALHHHLYENDGLVGYLIERYRKQSDFENEILAAMLNHKDQEGNTPFDIATEFGEELELLSSWIDLERLSDQLAAN